MSGIELSIVLPCRNERESVAACIAEIKKTALPCSYEIIVSDSSTDGSHTIAAQEGARIVKHDKEGYGLAIREGIENAEGDVVLFADADTTYSFAAIPSFLKALQTADLVIGSRFRGSIAPGAMPVPHRLLGTPLFNLLLFLFFGLKVSDSQSGFRAMRRAAFRELRLRTNGMEFATEMLIKAARANLRIREIPISYGVRKGDSKLRRYYDGFAHLKYILLEAPLLWYGGTGFLLLAMGAAGLLGMTGAFFGSATVRVIFPILGVQTLFLGLFAKTYLSLNFDEVHPFIRTFYRHYTLKTALSVGAVLVFVPLLFKLFSFSPFPFDTLLVSTIVGLQVIFNSVTLSTLSIK